jgi:hypothetical protein
MDIVLCHDGEELERVKTPVPLVKEYASLVQKFGYRDAEGNKYTYDHAQVEYAEEFWIYLEKKDE